MIRIALTCLFFVAACGHAAPSPAPASGPLAKLAWLGGTWVKTTGVLTSEETWSRPNRDTMFGSNRTFRGDKLVGFEFLLVRATDKGIVYQAWPGGKGPTTFTLKHMSDVSVTFENLAHDFPQRVIYNLRDGELHARIEGLQDGKPKSSQWVWRRPD